MTQLLLVQLWHRQTSKMEGKIKKNFFLNLSDLFPSYFGLTAKDLQMENLLADSRYVNRKSMRESLDSLASPVVSCF